MTSDVPAPGTAAPAPRSRLRRVGGWIAGVLVAGFLTAALIGGWSTVSSYPWQLDLPYLAVSVLGSAAALTLAAVGYAVMLERLEGRRLPRMRLVSIWGRSLLGRYVPGNVVMFAGRVVLGREAGVSGRVSLAASVYEQGLALGVSAAAAIGFLLYAGDLGQGPWLLIGAGVVLAGLLLLHPRVFGPLSGALLRKLGREPLEVFLSARQVLLFALLYAVTYGLLALGAWGSVRALGGPEAGGPAYVGSAFLLSFLVSMLAFVFPSGLGVREGILALALARNVPGGVAIGLAAATRLVMTVVEIAFAVAVVALERWSRRRSR
jgi:hypothetical protein